MLAVIDAVTKDSVTIPGFSEGAYTSYFVAGMYPARVKKLIAIGAGERDMNEPLGTIIAAYQMIPDCQLSIIPDAPHPVFLVNFPAVWDCVVPFLKQ